MKQVLILILTLLTFTMNAQVFRVSVAESQVLQYRYDDGSGAKPVRAYLEGDPLAAQDLELMNGQASDSKRWSLEPVPFFLPPFKNSKQ